MLASKLSIIVPTLRERDNLPSLVAEISSALEKTSGWEILIIDDNSNDGTIEICNKMAQKGHPIKLIVRENEKGLATAVLEGFRRASGSVFIVMDADLSHPPDCVPLLYKSILNGAEFSLGSRYIPGGGTDDYWTVFRYLNSKFATLLAKPLVNISDPMSGFFALPRHVWERGQGINPVGYKIGLELMVKCRPDSIVEVPIHFKTRRVGKSKLSFRQQLLYLVHVLRLYKYKFKGL